MENLKNFSFDKLKEITNEKKYNLVYINYDRANGIKVLSNIIELTEEEKNSFYRIYIFNDDYMVTIFNFGRENLKYNKIKKEDFDNYSEKYIYLETNKKELKNKRLKVRVGNLKIDNSREAIQYIDFIGGERA
ncbi:hypothetical protein [uncultured Fusobacterium sp.]|uniref:hypothetical protein n=1 Tax=uncultured Fusobacterium sp. TaxID=159267 RepID=UPI00265FBFAA|nr:hypothetical protein [uncultured Fusobacterium sp.]